MDAICTSGILDALWRMKNISMATIKQKEGS
jgi:hypothetical protein